MRKRLIGVSMLALCAAQGAASQAKAQTISTGSSASPQGKSGVEEIVVTATKRSERLQRVALAVQVLDGKTLAQQNVNGFQDYLKLIPSLTTQTDGPNSTSIYLRGVSSGDNANHSGPLPTVGSYLDETPITTIGGTLDVHAYDIARIEVLPGPQGTLYGASSEAGTVRIITNKPDPTHFSAGYSVEGNTVDHGGQGDVAEGFVNVPITDKIAVRIVGFHEHDAGYIDNVPGTITFPDTLNLLQTATLPGATVTNGPFVKKNFNPVDQFGGRVSAKIDLDENWSIEPMIMGQELRDNGIFAFNPGVGDLKTQRFQPDTDRDKWAQAALTVNGKIGNFDLTYAGSVFVRDVHQRIDYIDYAVAYEGYAQYFLGQDGNPLSNYEQKQDDKDHFTKVSNEIRLASPSTDRLRFIVGAFQEQQTHRIEQNYIIPGLSDALTIPGRSQQIWLTDQSRRDHDYAGFIDASFDVLPKFTINAGVRPYYYSNSLYGFYGFSAGAAPFGAYPPGFAYTGNPLDTFDKPGTGEGANSVNCKPGRTYAGAPCVNLDRAVIGSGETHKVNFSYRIDPDHMVYFTYSTGFRPGGVNRNGLLKPYGADTLTNFELGAKTQWFDRRLTVNVAAYDEDWKSFQFSFLGLNSLTVIQNAPAANIKGFELAASYRVNDQLTLTGDYTTQFAELNGNFCGADTTTGNIIPSCTAAFAEANGGAVSGSQLPFTSQNKGSFTARYTFPVTDAIRAHLQGTASAQSHQQVGLRVSDRQTLGSLPGYAQFDLSTGVEFHNAAFELFVKNLTDERGQENRYVECGPCTNVYELPITPRTIGIRLSQKF